MLAVPSAAPLPVPPATTISVGGGDPLLKTAQGIVQADPSVTLAELQKALGIPSARAQQLFSAATVQPGGVQPAAPATSTPLPVPSAGMLPVPPNPLSPPPPPAITPPPLPPPVGGTPPAGPQTPPTPTPGGPSPTAAANQAAHGAQAAVNAIAGLAAQGGPMGAAAGHAAAAAAAVPGAGAALSAVPGLAMAGPIVAAATAALAVPSAAMLTLNSIAQTARGQIQGLSPEVAQAEAQAMVRQLVANMRTSQRLGDEVADFISTRSRLSAAGQGLRDVALEPILQQFNDAQRGLAKATEAVNDFAQKQPTLVQGAVMFGVDQLISQLGLIGLLYRLSAWLGKEEAKEIVGVRWLIPQRPQLPPPFANDAPEVFSRTPMVASGAPGLSF